MRDEKNAVITLGRWLEAEKGRMAAGFRLVCWRDDHLRVNQWLAEPAGQSAGTRG